MGVNVDSKKNQNISKDIVKKERRSFLKKAVYAAPTVVCLGYLSRPNKLNAGDSDIPAGPSFTPPQN